MKRFTKLALQRASEEGGYTMQAISAGHNGPRSKRFVFERGALVKTVVTVLIGVGLITPSLAEWASGEIRRVDPDNLRLTIKHGEIKSLDMPPMTMVFYVNNKALISGLSAQDKIEFKATAEGKKYFVTDIRKAP